MTIKQIAAAVTTILICSTNAFAAKKTVAVMNFTNYGGPGIAYLSNALPESVSAALTELKELKIVERRNLGKLLDEIALEQSGIVNTKGVDRIGKIARADVLILGSVSGDPENIILTLKAVDVETGNILDAKTVKSPLGKIFEMAAQQSRSMGAMISGEGIGKISISTNPSGADVYVDGVQIGKTPIVEYKLTPGKHEVKATLHNHRDWEESVTIIKGEHEKFTPYLAENSLRNRSEFGLGASWMMPVNKEIQGGPYYYAFLGHTFERLMVSLEAGYGNPTHNQDIVSPFGTTTMKRWYDLYYIQGGINYIITTRFDYFFPYAGITVGYMQLNDYRRNEAFEDSNQRLKQQNMVNLGLRGGVEFLPYSKVSFFLEGRFNYVPQKLERYEFAGTILGEQKTLKKMTLMYFNIGAGLKYHF